MINDLWPEDITSEAVLPPFRVLLDQAEALAKRTNNLLEGQVRRRKDGDRIILGFEIVPHGVETRVRLFEVHHRAEFDYPVAIMFPSVDLPEYLKVNPAQSSNLMKALKAGIVNPNIAPPVGSPDFSQFLGERTEINWVATSPQEFNEKLKAVFALPQIKSRVLSLLARATEANDESGLIEEQESDGENPQND